MEATGTGAAGRRWDKAVLAALALWAVAPLAYVLARAAAGHGSLSGAFGLYPADQMLYLSWIRDAGEHGLISNRFDVVPSAHVYLQPMFLLSGLAWKAGVALPLSYLAWIPVAVGALFAGFRAYVRRTLGHGGLAPAAALTLALFYFSPAFPLLGAAGLGGADKLHLELLTYEAFNGVQVWGYLPATIAVGLLPLVLLGTERMLEPGVRARGHGRARQAGWTAAGAFAIAWLHPWQGATLVAILVAVALWGRLDRRYLALAAPLAGSALPLAYYYVLPRVDSAWSLGSRQAGYPHMPVLAAAALAPLAAFALAGVRRPAGVQERMLLLWPLAGAVVYLAAPDSPYHGLQSIALPLAILAVRGFRRVAPSRPPTRRALAAALVAAATLPGVVHAGYLIHKYVNGGRGPYLLRPGERRALTWLERAPAGGGVLARAGMGSAVPAYTGRQTWVGHPTWTPHELERARAADALFRGTLPAMQAAGLVRASRAAFLLSDCSAGADLRPALGPSFSVHRFGCATVYVRRAPIRPTDRRALRRFGKRS